LLSAIGTLPVVGAGVNVRGDAACAGGCAGCDRCCRCTRCAFLGDTVGGGAWDGSGGAPPRPLPRAGDADEDAVSRDARKPPMARALRVEGITEPKGPCTHRENSSSGYFSGGAELLPFLPPAVGVVAGDDDDACG
jgi:hypothetical protein